MSVELRLKSFSPAEIAEITGGRLEIYGSGNSDDKCIRIVTDSREAEEGSIFFAIKGQNVDGNDFIAMAVDGGAKCVIGQNVPDDAKNRNFCAVIVDDTIRALGEIASEYRKYSRAKFIAVTGSVGKTTTKEMIYAVASVSFHAYKTKGNYNSEIGLPLTIFGIGPEDEVVVLEMGMSAMGEIEHMTRIARPDIAIITNIGTSHLASLGTRENICRAKMEIRLGLPEDGVLLINADEPLLMEQYEILEKKPLLMSVFNRLGDYRAVNIRQKPDMIIYDLLYKNKAVTNVEIPSMGKHNVYNSLAAFAVGTLLGMGDEQIRKGLKNFNGVDKRQNIYDLYGITVIDDCYNASPESMHAAIDVLVSIAKRKSARATALLGDMLELGDYSRLMHDQLGQYAAQMKVQKLFCFGSMADVIAEAAIKNGIRAEDVSVCIDSRDADGMAEMILSTLKPGDVLLVKASRGIAAERVIESIKKKKQTKRGRRKKIKAEEKADVDLI